MSAESQPGKTTATSQNASETECKTARRRAAVMSEIISTEDVYLKNLSTLVETFQRPLSVIVEQLERDDLDLAVKGMFRHIPQILGFHSLLLSDLKKCTSPSEIADTFKRVSPFFKLYTAYINEYDHYIDSVTLLRETKKTNAVLESAKETNGGRDIMSFLITPVQRIPRFELLLRELKRYCTKDDETASLDAALESVKSVAMKINEAKRDAEQKSRLVEILSMLTDLEEHITPPFLRPSRKFIHAGYMWEVPDQFSARRKERFVILLNDLVIWTECVRANKSYRVKGALTLDTCEVMLHDGVVVSTQPLFTPEGEPCTSSNWPAKEKPAVLDLLAPPPVVPSTIRSPLTSSLLFHQYELPAASSPTNASQGMSSSTGLFSSMGIKPVKTVKFIFPDTAFPLSSSAISALSQELVRGALPSPTINLSPSALEYAAAAGSSSPPPSVVFPSLAGFLSSLSSEEYAALQTVWLETFDKVFEDTRLARASVMIQLKSQVKANPSSSASAAGATPTGATAAAPAPHVQLLNGSGSRKAPPCPAHARTKSSLELMRENSGSKQPTTVTNQDDIKSEWGKVANSHQRSSSDLFVPVSIKDNRSTHEKATEFKAKSPEVISSQAAQAHVDARKSDEGKTEITKVEEKSVEPAFVAATARPPRPSMLNADISEKSVLSAPSPLSSTRSSLPPPVPTAPRHPHKSSVASYSAYTERVVEVLGKAVNALQCISRAEITFLKQVGRARAPPRFIFAVEAVAIAVNWAQTQGKDPATTSALVAATTPRVSTTNRRQSGSFAAAPSPSSITPLRSRHSFTFGVDASSTAALAATIAPTLTSIQSGRPPVALSPTAISMLVSTHLSPYLQSYSKHALSLTKAASNLPLSSETKIDVHEQSELPPVDKIVTNDFTRLDAILRTSSLQDIAQAPNRKTALALLGDSRAALVFWAFALALHAAQTPQKEETSFSSFPPEWAFETDQDHSVSSNEHKSPAEADSTSKEATRRPLGVSITTPTKITRPGTAKPSLSPQASAGADVRSRVGGVSGSLSRIARPKTAVASSPRVQLNSDTPTSASSNDSASKTPTGLSRLSSARASTSVTSSAVDRVRPSTAASQPKQNSLALPSQGMAARNSVALAPRPSLDSVLKGRAVHGITRATAGTTSDTRVSSSTESSASNATKNVRPQGITRPSTATSVRTSLGSGSASLSSSARKSATAVSNPTSSSRSSSTIKK